MTGLATLTEQPTSTFSMAVGSYAAIRAEQVAAHERWITVSGYPSILAHVVTINGNEIGTVSGSVHLAVLDGIDWLHCPRCNRAMKPGLEHGQSLGFPLCVACDRAWRYTCLSLCGRLPTAGEFFCRGCTAILDRGQLCRPDADGRRRWRCRPCRAAQVAAADQRRRERA
jgi:hypothetical protein